MDKRKKSRLVVAAIGGIIVLLAASGAVFAYFTSLSAVDNVIAVVDNVVEVSEHFDPPEEQVMGDNIFPKEVTVTNTGGTPCYVRAYVDFSSSFVRSVSYLSADADSEGQTFYSAERTIDPTDGVTTFVEYVNSGEDWHFVPDDSDTVLSGYYYYTRPLAAGASSPPLLTFVKTVNATVDDIDQYDILVYAESMQLTDINGSVYEDYAAAWTDYLA